MQVLIYALHIEGKYYIGKTNDADRRWKEHGKHDMEIIDNIPEGEWQATEIYWIKQYRMAYGKENILNQTEGGEGGKGFLSGEDHPNTTVSEDTINLIKQLALNGYSQKDIAEITDRPRPYVNGVIRGRNRGEGVNVQGYMRYPEFIQILKDYHVNGLDIEPLMEKYDRKQLSIKRALQHYHFQTDLYPALEVRDRAEQISRGNFGAFKMRWLNQNGHIPNDIAEDFNTTGKNVRNYLRNNTNADPNWDHVERVYKGEPKGWEDWWEDELGHWSTSSV